MKASFKCILPLVTLLLLVACASTTIYPMGNNTYSLVTTSASQGVAEKAAKKKAAEYCAQNGQYLIVLSHNAVYQGVKKNEAAMIDLASSVIGADSVSRSDDDYKVTLKFSCR